MSRGGEGEEEGTEKGRKEEEGSHRGELGRDTRQ